AISVVALVLWAGWWTLSLRQGRMVAAGKTWVPAYESLGIDFASNWFAVRHWVAGGDPYREPFDDPLDRPLVNPPLILPLFAWSALLPFRWASVVWFASLVAFAGLAAWSIVGVRSILAHSELTISF